MPIFNLYIFDRHGKCIFYDEWNRKTSSFTNPEEEQKLMYGLLWSLKSFAQKTSPFPDQEKSCVQFYKTNAYKLHYLETPTSLKFVLLSDPETPDLRDTLRQIYRNVFVEYAIKNPLYKIGDPIKCELFSQNLQKEIKQIAAPKK